MAPDPLDLVAVLSLEVPGDDALAVLGRCLPLAQDLGATAVDVVRPAGDDARGAVALHVPLGARAAAAPDSLLPEVAGASGDLLARFGWHPGQLRARWSPDHRDYVEVQAPPASLPVGSVTGLSVMTWASLVHDLGDGLEGDETVDYVGRRRRYLDVPVDVSDLERVFVRVHAVLDAGDLAEAAGRLQSLTGETSPAGISLDLDRDHPTLIHAALLYRDITTDATDLEGAATAAAARFGLTDHLYRLHVLLYWEVGAIEAAPISGMAPKTGVHAVYVRRGVDPFADFAVFSQESVGDEALGDDSFTQEDAERLMRSLEVVLVRVGVGAEFVGVPPDQARAFVDQMLRRALPAPVDGSDLIMELRVRPRAAGVVVTALAAPKDTGELNSADALSAVRTAVGTESGWTVQQEPDDGRQYAVCHWQGTHPSGLVRLEVHAGRLLSLHADD